MSQLIHPARLQALFEASPVGIGLSDERGRLVAANPALCALLGRPAEALTGRALSEFAAPDDDVTRAPRRYLRPDGEVRWADPSSVPVPGPGGQAWTLTHVRDVTDLRESQQSVVAVAAAVRALRTGADVRGTALDAAISLGGADGAYLVELETDPDGEPLVDAALVVTACRGRAGRAAVGTRIPLHTTAACVDVFRAGQPLFLADPAEHAVASPSLLALSGARSLLFQPVGLHGAVLGVLAVAWDERLASVADHRAATVALLADETAVALDTEAMMLRLEVRSTTDALTGLPNRRAWDQTLPALLDSARRSGTPLTVAVADLDHFRRYNDTLGHRAGDDLLRRFAGHCTGAVRNPDLVARWGGEEFALALPACSVEHATRVLERVRTDVPDGQTCSVGFAVWDGAEGPDELLARADAALYRAKSLGRDTLCGAGPVPPEVS